MSAAAEPGAWAPLRERAFALLWVANLVGNLGSFMRDAATAWMASELSASPAAVALIQACATLPVCLLAFPAGALSDIVDRRRLLVAAQLGLAACSAGLALLAWNDALSIPALALFTFIGGIGAALVGPSWQAVVPQLVPRMHLRNAVALNAMGFNVSRALGPAMGGLLLAASGAAVVYLADMLSYAFVVAALLVWRAPQRAPDPLAEHFGSALRAGWRHARANEALRSVLWRASGFLLCTSAAWALLPLVARRLPNADAGTYGLLLGAAGVGAVLGALALPKWRQRYAPDTLVTSAALMAATVNAALCAPLSMITALALLCVLGVAWIVALTTLNGAAQAVLPDWVRGRGLAMYLTVFSGSLAVGSLGWGGLAQAMGVPATMLAAGVTLALTTPLLRRRRLPLADADLQPASPWPEPLLVDAELASPGPVLVQVSYRVRASDRAEFVRALQRLGEARRASGAYAWGMVQHSTEPEHLMEWFLVESWAEHLRQHRRASNADRELQEAVVRLHAETERPKAQHFVALRGA